MTAQDRFRALEAQPLVTVGSSAGVGSSAWGAFKGILAHREMLNLLVRRDIRSRYKDSSLGFVWALIRPLTQLAIYYLVIGRVLGAERGIPEFAIYVYTGLTAYGLFSEIVSGGTSSIVSNAGLIKKVYFQREVFPLASVGSALFNFVVQLVILTIATIAFGSPPLTLEAFFFIPAIGIVLVWGLALALLLAAVNVYLRDVQYLVEVVILLLMWASPIVYTWSMVATITKDHPWLLDVYTNNPVTLAVLGFQRVFWVSGHGLDPQPYPDDLLVRMIIAIGVGVVALFAAQRVFSRLQGNFAQEL